MHRERAQRTQALLLAGASLVVGLMLTAGTVATLDSRLRASARGRFDESAARAESLVEAQLEEYLDELRGVGAFLLAREAPPASEVEAFVREARIFEQTESILGVVVLHRVTSDAVDAFTATMRGVDPEFAVLAIEEIPADAPHYVVTYDVAGDIDLGLPPGLDLSIIESVRLELEARGLAGEAAAGALQDDPGIRDLAERYDAEVLDTLREAIDFFVAVPVYPLAEDGPSDGMPVAWVVAPVGRFDEALAQMVDAEPGELGVRLSVALNNAALEGEAAERIALRTGDAGELARASFRRDSTLDVSGLEMSMTVWSDPVAGGSDREVLAVVALAGLVTAASAAGFVYLRIITRSRALALDRMRALEERATFQADILASVDEAVVVLDPQTRVVAGNDAWDRLRTRDGAAVHADGGNGRRYLDLVRLAPAAATWVGDAFDAVLEGTRESVEIDLRIESDERRSWSSVRITPLHGEPGGLVVVHRDITARKRSEQDLARRATHDQLTGLLNRSGLEDGVGGLLDRARSSQVPIAALFVDLDDFKEINDTWGHGVGDAVLRVVAQRLTASVRASDLVARIGGDEFVILLFDPLRDGGSAITTAERILEAMEAPMRAAGIELTVRASIGVVVVADAADVSTTGLLQRADHAMYAAKRRGGARYSLVDD